MVSEQLALGLVRKKAEGGNFGFSLDFKNTKEP